jgi:PAS domain S-box-containing protein
MAPTSADRSPPVPEEEPALLSLEAGASLEALLRDQRALSSGIADAASVDEVVERCARFASAVVGVDVVAVHRVDEGGALVLSALLGAGRATERALARIPPRRPEARIMGERAGEGACEPALRELPRALAAAEEPEPITGSFVVPFLHRERPLGALLVASRSLAALPSPLLDALETLGTLAGEALARLSAEASARASAAEYAALVQASLDGFVVVGEGGRILDANDAFCAMVGRPRDALASLGIAELDAERSPAEIEALLSTMRARGFARFDVRMRRADGGALHAEVSAWAVPGRGHIVSFVRDRTEETRARAALEEHERRYQSVLRGSMDGFAVVTADGALLEANPVLCEMLGHTREELLSRRAVDFAAVLGQEAAIAMLAEVRARGRARFEGALRGRGGRALPVEVSAWSSDADGTVLAFVRDLSARRRAEADLREREAQLRQAQKMEAVGRLAGGVAHDFNNLLTVILSCADLVAQAVPATSQAAADLEEVRRAAERAEGLTRQLLAFSRKSIVRPELLDVGEVIASVERMLRRLIGEDVMLVVSRARASEVRVDRGQLEQVLMNLAVNARDAMPSGGRLSIAARDVQIDASDAAADPSLRAGRFVRLTVTDDGCGMDDATLARLFEPFFTTKAPGKGTGLGLSTVYGIVQQNEGLIRVRSAPSRGTTFEIDLPLAEAVQAPARDDAPSPLPTSHRGRVLVVEDEPGLRVLVRRVLVSAGYDAMVAASAQEAIALFERESCAFDLLLTDVVMPGMDGRALSEQLRARLPALRVLYMSGYAENVLGQHGVFDDGVHLLAKPFTARVLVERVQRALTT